MLASARAASARLTFVISRHAEQRMGERGVQSRDIASALGSATKATYRNDRGTWTLEGGLDLDEQRALTVVIAFTEATVVVTIYWENDGDDEDVR